MKMWYIPIVLLVAGLAYSYWFGYTPPLIALVYFIASVISYGLYAKDKMAATNGRWRVPENTLHISALMCGWPGAIIGQQRLRHKTKKVSFRVVFVITLFINISLLGWLHTLEGSQKIQRSINKMEAWAANQLGGHNSVTVLFNLMRFH